MLGATGIGPFGSVRPDDHLVRPEETTRFPGPDGVGVAAKARGAGVCAAVTFIALALLTRRPDFA